MFLSSRWLVILLLLSCHRHREGCVSIAVCLKMVCLVVTLTLQPWWLHSRSSSGFAGAPDNVLKQPMTCNLIITILSPPLKRLCFHSGLSVCKGVARLQFKRRQSEQVKPRVSRGAQGTDRGMGCREEISPENVLLFDLKMEHFGAVFNLDLTEARCVCVQNISKSHDRILVKFLESWGVALGSVD